MSGPEEGGRSSAPLPEAWLDQQVKTLDPGRWLTSRFVSDASRHTDLLALYAFEAELAAIPTRVTQPLLAEMRLTWWADQLDGVFAGEPRKGHPVLEAMSASVIRHSLDRAVLEALIEARIRLVHGDTADITALAVSPMRQTARILGAGGDEAALDPAGRLAWAVSCADLAQASDELRREINDRLTHFPVAAFPAILPAALRPGDPMALRQRLRLILASLRGRI